MRAEVADVLTDRAAGGGVKKSVSASLAIHIAIIAFFLFVPRDLFTHKEAEAKIMTITMSAGDGPKTTGINSAGARTVEKAEPEPKKPEVIKAATPKADAMTVAPKKDDKPEKPKKDPPKNTPTPTPPPEKPPTTGKTVTQGTSLAETGAKGQGSGLSTGGGAAAAQLGLPDDFCCMAYVNDEVLGPIERNWLKKSTEGPGEAKIAVTIFLDGHISIKTESATNPILEYASRDAFGRGLKFAPLPPEYKGATLTIHLTFPYAGR